MLHQNSFFAPLTVLTAVSVAGIVLFLVYANHPAPAPLETNLVAASAATSPESEHEQKNEEAGAVSRIENPYNEPPLPFPSVTNRTEDALVNVLCTPEEGGMQPTSGSGVIIDPRGVILTNAHVAQYVLLSQSPLVDLSCVVRAGSPASPAWDVEVMFIPSAWVELHAKDLTSEFPTTTGEYDYALLRITRAAAGTPLPPAIPFLPIDTREAVAFLGDEVVVAGYPAEFVGASSARSPLFRAASVTTIQELLTFKSSTVDLMSVGGVVEAQSGSSGGPVVNAWGRLVGLVSTTSDAPTTQARDLRALTLSYIDRDLKSQAGASLHNILAGNVARHAAAFRAKKAPLLMELLLTELRKSR